MRGNVRGINVSEGDKVGMIIDVFGKVKEDKELCVGKE